MRIKARTPQGFSVLEVLLALTILVFILTIVFIFLIRGYDVFLGVDSSAQSVRIARRTIATMVKDLREARDSETGAHAIVATADDATTFYADTDDDGDVERVRFALEGTNLIKGVVEPPYSGAESIEVIGTDISNTALFTYYDGSYDGTGDPLVATGATTPYRVRFIEVAVEIDHDLSDAIDPLSARSAVQLRNLPFPF